MKLVNRYRHAVRLGGSASHATKVVFSLLFVFFQSLLFSNSLADSASKAYEKQEFKMAVTCYEKILAQGKTSATLYYNLGNSYYKDNQLGKAIYYYELAKKLNPNDEDIKNNLIVANTKLIDKIESKENFFAGAIKSGVYALFNTTGWAWLSIFSLLFTLGFFLLFIISKNLSLKRSGFLLGAVCALCFIISFSVGYSALHNLNKKTRAIVVSQTSQVLNAPADNGKSKFVLHEGTKLTVLSSNTDWTAIQLANGNEGWIRTKELGLF